MRLYTKVLLYVALTCVFAGQGIIVYSQKAVHAALVAQIQMDGEKAALDTAGRLTPAIHAADERRILPLLNESLQITGGVYAFVLDGKGRVLGHSNVAEAGKIYRDAHTLNALRSKSRLSRELLIDGRPVLELTTPLFDESTADADEDFLLADAGGPTKGAHIGVLRVGLPLEQALATERHIGSGILRVVLILGGVAFAMLFYFMRRLLEPIGLLSAATAKIRGGDYGGAIPVTTDDEIGALARSFNAMSLELGETTVSKDFFNDILKHIQDQLVVTDAAGRVTMVNPAVAGLLGYSADELVGMPSAALLADASVSFTAPTRNVATHFLTKSGEKLPVLFSASPMAAADGGVTGWIGAAKDISDLRKLEARVHQSEKLSAVGQLAAGVAHEINNPLGVILGFAQALRRQLAAGDALELPITSIEREALRCKALVQDLLTFARTSHSDRSAMSLNEAVALSLPLITPQAKMGGVRVTTALAEGLPPILGNKSQLEQVIMNLAKNAIDAMPNGGNLSLETELLEGAPHSWVCLNIGDDGTGIAAAVQSKIFDPFFTTKPLGQGTGLGLSLVSEIVQKHSGELTVDSRPGRTVFTIKLPARTGREIDSRLQELQRERLAEASAAKGAISHG